MSIGKDAHIVTVHSRLDKILKKQKNKTNMTVKVKFWTMTERHNLWLKFMRKFSFNDDFLSSPYRPACRLSDTVMTSSIARLSVFKSKLVRRSVA